MRQLETDYKAVLAINTCLLAGQILIESGSDMERVNDTMYRMAANANLKSFQVFTTLTGLVASAEHLSNAQVVDIRTRYNDLTRIAQVNEISRGFAKKVLSLEETYQRLSAISNSSVQRPLIVRCLAAAVLSVVLMTAFTGNVHDAPISFVIGGVAYGVYLKLVNRFKVHYLGEFCTALVIGELSLMAVKVGIATNINDVIIGAVMSLVPGIPLTNAARDIVSGNLISGIVRALEAFLVAIAIGCAIVLVLRYQ